MKIKDRKKTQIMAFTKENQPDPSKKKRGKSERTKILEAMERTGKSEEGFYDLLISKAHDPEDSFSFGELLKRLSPVQKSVSPLINFDMPKDSKPHEKAGYVIEAIASGKIPADLGSMVIASITSMLKIQEVTEFEERLTKLELLDGSVSQSEYDKD